MHKYNNQDRAGGHGCSGQYRGNLSGKQNIWAVNTEQEYIEESRRRFLRLTNLRLTADSAGANEPLRYKEQQAVLTQANTQAAARGMPS
jgi:hypothetical protein